MADWIILDKTTGIGSDEVTITVSSYTELTERLKNLVFTTTDNKATDTCVVRQYGESGYLKANPSSISMVYGGGYVDVTVSSTEAWTIGSLPSWITCNSVGGKKGDTIIRLTISASSSTSERSYTISLTSENYNASISVSQAKYAEGGIVPPSINPDDCEGGTFTVRITGDGCWSFEGFIPEPICDDALVWGEDRVAGDRSMKVKINGVDYNATQEGTGVSPGNWALCGYTGGTITSLEKMFWEDQKNMLRSVAFKNDFDTSNVTNMSRMFDNRGGSTYTGITRTILHSLDLSMFDTSKVTDMSYMFRLCNYLPLIKADGWDVSNVEDMSYMFQDCNANIDVSGWNTSKVRNMSYMFYHTYFIPASSGSIGVLPAVPLPRQRDIEKWDVSNVEDMSYMFYMNEIKNDYDLTGWNPAKVTTMKGMFKESYSEILNMSGWNLPEVLTIELMFYNMKYLTSLDLSGWNMPKVKTIENAFSRLPSLERLDVRNWKLPSCTDFSNAFYTNPIKEIDCTGWDTSGGEKMSYMFSNCSGLESLDLSSFDTSKVTNMQYMFSGCNRLTSLDLSNFKITDGTYIYRMFYGSPFLATVKVTNCDSATQDKILAQLKADLPSYTWTLSNGIITRS